MRQRVVVPAERGHLEGLLRVPERAPQARPAPAVVLCRDFAVPGETTCEAVAAGLERAGIVTLRCEGPVASPEGSDAPDGAGPRAQAWSDAGGDPLSDVADARAAARFLRRHPAVEGASVLIWGAGLGGGVALQAASLEPDVAGAVAVCPVGDGARWLRGCRGAGDWSRWSTRLAGAAAAPEGEGAGLAAVEPAGDAVLVGDEAYALWVRAAWGGAAPRVSARVAARILEFRPERFVDLLRGRPCWILAARTDTVVPLDEALACAAAAGPRVRLRLAPAGAVREHHDLWRGPGLVWMIREAAAAVSEVWIVPAASSEAAASVEPEAVGPAPAAATESPAEAADAGAPSTEAPGRVHPAAEGIRPAASLAVEEGLDGCAATLPAPAAETAAAAEPGTVTGESAATPGAGGSGAAVPEAPGPAREAAVEPAGDAGPAPAEDAPGGGRGADEPAAPDMAAPSGAAANPAGGMVAGLPAMDARDPAETPCDGQGAAVAAEPRGEAGGIETGGDPAATASAAQLPEMPAPAHDGDLAGPVPAAAALDWAGALDAPAAETAAPHEIPAPAAPGGDGSLLDPAAALAPRAQGGTESPAAQARDAGSGGPAPDPSPAGQGDAPPQPRSPDTAAPPPAADLAGPLPPAPALPAAAPTLTPAGVAAGDGPIPATDESVRDAPSAQGGEAAAGPDGPAHGIDIANPVLGAGTVDTAAAADVAGPVPAALDLNAPATTETFSPGGADAGRGPAQEEPAAPATGTPAAAQVQEIGGPVPAATALDRNPQGTEAPTTPGDHEAPDTAPLGGASAGQDAGLLDREGRAPMQEPATTAGAEAAGGPTQPSRSPLGEMPVPAAGADSAGPAPAAAALDPEALAPAEGRAIETPSTVETAAALGPSGPAAGAEGAEAPRPAVEAAAGTGPAPDPGTEVAAGADPGQTPQPAPDPRPWWEQ